MNSIRIKCDSKAGLLLAHIIDNGVQIISACDAAVVMGIERQRVGSLLAHAVTRYLRMTWEQTGTHYQLADGVTVRRCDGGFDVYLPGHSEGDEDDGDDYQFLKGCRTWIPADRVPPPKTNGVRSVFELAGRLK